MDHAEQALVDAHQQWCAAALSDALHFAGQRRGHFQALHADECQHCVDGALAIAVLLQVDARQPRLGAERHRIELPGGRFDEVMQLAQVLDDRLALGGVVRQRGQQGALPQLAGGDARRGVQGAAAAVAEGDGAGLVEHQRVHVTGRLHRAAGAGDDIQPHQPVHAGNADGRQQATDGGGDQRHQQCGEEDQRQAATNEVGERLQGHHHDQEDQGQADQQDVEGDLVRGLLPLGAFDQGNHAVEGGFTRVAGDADQQPVGDQPGITGHRRSVAAGLADHRRGLASNGGLVDRSDTFKHLAVTGDHFTGHHAHHIVLAQRAGRDGLVAAITLAKLGGQALAAGPEAVGAGLATALGKGLCEVGEQHGEPQPQGDLHGNAGAHAATGCETQDGGQ